MKTLENQSYIDLSIQHSGSAEAAYQMAKLNGQSVTDVPVMSVELIEPDVVNKPVATYYANKGIKPATASDDVDDTQELERIFFQELPVEFS